MVIQVATGKRYNTSEHCGYNRFEFIRHSFNPTAMSNYTASDWLQFCLTAYAVYSIGNLLLNMYLFKLERRGWQRQREEHEAFMARRAQEHQEDLAAIRRGS